MKGKVPLGGPATWDREDPDAGLVVTPQLNMIHPEDLYSFKRSSYSVSPPFFNFHCSVPDPWLMFGPGAKSPKGSRPLHDDTGRALDAA